MTNSPMLRATDDEMPEVVPETPSDPSSPPAPQRRLTTGTFPSYFPAPVPAMRLSLLRRTIPVEFNVRDDILDAIRDGFDSVEQMMFFHVLETVELAKKQTIDAECSGPDLRKFVQHRFIVHFFTASALYYFCSDAVTALLDGYDVFPDENLLRYSLPHSTDEGKFKADREKLYTAHKEEMRSTLQQAVQRFRQIKKSHERTDLSRTVYERALSVYWTFAVDGLVFMHAPGGRFPPIWRRDAIRTRPDLFLL